MTSEQRHEARRAGHRSGRLDRFIGIRNAYAWHCGDGAIAESYSAVYSQAYQDGWHGRPS